VGEKALDHELPAADLAVRSLALVGSAALPAVPMRLVAEPSQLRRTLGRLDALAFVITAVVVLDTIGAVAVGGAQAFLWLAVMGVLFLYPSALVTAELSAAFPQEGGHYVWASKAFGRTVGALSSLFYWAESPIWIGGSLAITSVAVVDRSFVRLDGARALAGVLVFVAITIGCALLPMRIGRLVPIVGAAARFALLGGFTLAVGIYAASHGVHGVRHLTDFSPTFATFGAIVPVLLYNYLGFDIPATAGGELRDPQRDLPRAALQGGAWTFVLYAVPVAAVLVVLPATSVTSLHGFIDAIDVVFTPFGGHVGVDGRAHLAGAGRVLADLCALGFVVVLLTSGATWLIGSVRSQAIACLDGAGPVSLGRLDDDGTPRRLVLVSGAIATAVALGAYAVSGSNADRYFTAALSLSIATIAISYLAAFAALPRLRRTHAQVPRPYRIPGGACGAYLASGLCVAWTLGSLALMLWPPQLPTGFAHGRLAFELTQCIPLAALALAGVAFAASGRGARSTEPAPDRRSEVAG
jgi:glutamate:GABA antiporter